MRPADIRAFVQRPWADAELAKREHWLAVARREGAAKVLRIADALREHVQRFAGEALTAERAADWEHHLELERRIDAASRRIGR